MSFLPVRTGLSVLFFSFFSGLLTGQGLRPPLPPQTPLPGNLPRIHPDGGNLFQILQETWDRVPLFGRRRYLQVISPEKIVRYEERIAIDPGSPSAPPGRRARFELKLLQTDGLARRLNEDERALRAAAFAYRAGFLHYQRDFRVHDMRLAERNYRVVPMGMVIRNGRLGRLFDVLPRNRDLSAYRLLIDAEHQVLLDQAEFSPGGMLVSAIEYHHVVLGEQARRSFPPDVVWWKPYIPMREHKNPFEAGRVAGFSPKVPDSLPGGFSLLNVRTAKDTLTSFIHVVQIFTDGIETFYLIQSRSTPLTKVSPLESAAATSSQQLVNVKRFRFGPVAQYQADYQGRSYLLLGNFHTEQIPPILLDLLK